jgi:single-strand DNA-binding protein
MANLSLNKVILGGRLTNHPELKQTPNGVAVTTFSIAINRRAKKDEADFINVVAFRQTAEFICKYFGKGSSISIVGELQTRQWKDNNGQNRYATEVLVSEVNFVDSKSDNAPASAPAYMPDAYKLQKFQSITPAVTGYQEMSGDDDLPF